MRHRLFWATLAVCIAGCASSPTDSPEALVTRAEAHHKAGDTIKAYRLYHRAAEAGSWKAQYALGDFYRMGGFSTTDSTLADTYIRFVAKREETSEVWHRRAVSTIRQAADEGDPEAQYNLGILYLYGSLNGVGQSVIEEDREVGKQWVMRAAEQDHARALFVLGAHFNKWFEPEEAYGLLERAAALGCADAYGTMAWYHYRGTFTDCEMDHVRFVGLMRQGIEQGSRGLQEWLDDFLNGLERGRANGFAESLQVLSDLEAAGLLGGRAADATAVS
jgi:TPR repeat protein